MGNIRTDRFQMALKEKSGLLLVLLILMLIFGFLTKGRFWEIANLINLLRAISLSTIVAFGMTLCIITGGIDLSVGALMAVSSTYCAGLIEHNAPTLVAVLAGILMAFAMGTVNGFLISRTPIPPFIATLSMMTAARGVAYMYSGGRPIRTPTGFGAVGNGYLFDIIPYPVIIALVIMIIMSILLNRTKFGRSIFALGGSREAAVFSGIDIKKTLWSTYALTGFLCGISGVIWASRTYSGQPTLGTGAEMDAIAAAVVGGTSMAGGVGSILGTFIGALIIQVLNSGLNYLNVPFYYNNILRGVVIAGAVLFDMHRKSGRGSVTAWFKSLKRGGDSADK
jgi:ribose transport system permease protein